MKAQEFDDKFDRGEDVTEFLDLSSSYRPGHSLKRVNVDCLENIPTVPQGARTGSFRFPSWMIDALDREAERLGVTRQSIIKVWLAERLERK